MRLDVNFLTKVLLGRVQYPTVYNSDAVFCYDLGES